MLLFPAGSHATARTIPSRGAFGTRALAGDARVVDEAARAEAERQPRRLADPDPERAALDDPQLRLPRVGGERQRDGRGRDRVGRLDDRLVLAVDEPADALGAVPVDLPRTRARAGLRTASPPTCRSSGSAPAPRPGAASANLNEIWSARPSAFGENASRVAATLPSVRVTASCVDDVATRPPVALAASSIRKMPSGSGAGSKRSTCSPARFHAFGNVADLGAEHVADAHGHVRGRVQRVRDRRAVGDRVAVRRDRLGVGGEPGDRERDVTAADHALRRRDAVVRADRVRVAARRDRRRVPGPVDVGAGAGRGRDGVARRRRRRRPSRAAATRASPGTAPCRGPRR